MEYLFKTSTTYTFEEYKKFVLTLNKKRMTVLFVYMTVFLFLSAVLFWFTRSLTSMVCMILFLLYMPLVVLLQNRSIKKTFHSNKSAQNRQDDIEFYEDRMIAKSGNNISEVQYNNLYRIIQTKTNVYLMIAKNQGFVLVKANFPEGLEEFLQKLESTTNKKEKKTK